MKRLLTLLVCLFALPALSQPLIRGFFDTNANPQVVVAAGANITVTATSTPPDLRTFTVGWNLSSAQLQAIIGADVYDPFGAALGATNGLGSAAWHLVGDFDSAGAGAAAALASTNAITFKFITDKLGYIPPTTNAPTTGTAGGLSAAIAESLVTGLAGDLASAVKTNESRAMNFSGPMTNTATASIDTLVVPGSATILGPLTAITSGLFDSFAGPLGVTNSAAETTIYSCAIAAHTIGANGDVRINVMGNCYLCPANASINIYYNTTQVSGMTLPSGVARNFYYMRQIFNRNSEAAQVSFTATTGTYADSGSTMYSTAFNTGAAFTLYVKLAANSSVGTNVVEAISVEILRK